MIKQKFEIKKKYKPRVEYKCWNNGSKCSKINGGFLKPLKEWALLYILWIAWLQGEGRYVTFE